MDDFSTASASPFPTEEVPQESQDATENKDTKDVAESSSEAAVIIATSQNSTDEEKLLSAGKMAPDQQEFSLNNRYASGWLFLFGQNDLHYYWLEQGSHSHRKSGKIMEKFVVIESQGKVMENDKNMKSHGKVKNLP